jgi:acetyl esterase/lipase
MHNIGLRKKWSQAARALNVFWILALALSSLPTVCTHAQDTAAAAAGASPFAQSQGKVLRDIPYLERENLSPLEEKYCRLDLYLPLLPDSASVAQSLPQKTTGFSSIVWFHGGGLKAGDKASTRDSENGRESEICAQFAKAGFAILSANYRLSPKVQYPAYVEDAAAAFSWAKKHIADHGGDPSRVFLAGHSAGAYLALLLSMDPNYLSPHGLALESVAGTIAVSGQTMTHYTVREERGISKHSIIADAAAPVFHIRRGLRPMLILFADKDMPGRAEENQYFAAIAQDAGNPDIRTFLAKNRNHGSIANRMSEPGDPTLEAILAFVRKHNASQ